MKLQRNFFGSALLVVLGSLAACSRATLITSPTTLVPVYATAPAPSATPGQPLEDLQSKHDGYSGTVARGDCRAIGWLVDAAHPNEDLSVRVLVDDVEVAAALADQPRVDLQISRKCMDGSCAFDVDLWPLLAPNTSHTVLVQTEDPSSGDWITLNDSPHTLTCTGPVGVAGGEPVITSDPSGRVRFAVGDAYLILEFLDDDLLHFEISGVPTVADLSAPLHTTPMVAKTDYPGPSVLTSPAEGVYETPDLRVEVDPASLCLTAVDITRQQALTLTTLCPYSLGTRDQGFTLTPESFTQAYGLGEAFSLYGSNSGDWVGRVRLPGNAMGNAMVGWNGGGVGNAQFPVVYFAGAGYDSYALFADNAYAQYWDFTKSPWQVDMGGNWLRFYLMSGPDLQDLRRDYLELTGRPPVPPKKMFGLWISEYGYDNWNELEDKLATLRANQFPVDGFVLDLQWFGGVTGSSDNSQMGSLSWDLNAFPDPAGHIADLKARGIGIITIEEPYISRGLPEHADLQARDFLARACTTCPTPAYLTANPWWGQGGMVDWTNPEAGAYWHNLKREPLIAAGVIGHWTDLGEPEMFDPSAGYFGITGDYTLLNSHPDIHNLYNLLWSKSVFDGYLRNGHTQRPFILSRSGTSGSQHYAVSMWSGDIGSNLSSLAAHINVQMHMSFSGMDYFGADIGGFHRGGLDGDLNEMYTRWFAVGSLLDIPVRAHTENLCNCKETAPDRIGDLPSNLQAVRLRYALSPYLYSLSHRAYLFGDPVYPPLVYQYQADPNVREMGDEKMIGPSLLVKLVAEYASTETSVYLPAGEWYDYYTSENHVSAGEWLGSVPLFRDGLYSLPLFARSGAILPLMFVDDQTLNILGQRSDGFRRDDLMVRVFQGLDANEFTLYEDDGETIAYQRGEVRTTVIQFRPGETGSTVTIAAAQGTYQNAPDRRTSTIEFVSRSGSQFSTVTLNGLPLTRYPDRASFDTANSGWYLAGNNLVIAKSSDLPVNQEKVFVFGG